MVRRVQDVPQNQGGRVLPMFERAIRRPSDDVEYLRMVQTWMNPGLEFSAEKAAEKERIARLFGKSSRSVPQLNSERKLRHASAEC